MPKKPTKSPRWAKTALTLLVLLGLPVLLYSNTTNKDIVRRGNPSDSSPKEIILQSCGSRLPEYKYSIELPANWTVKRSSYDEASTYFKAENNGQLFIISCTNQGVGGGCEEQFKTKFAIGGKEYDACFSLIDGKFKLSDFNLPPDPKTNATISFWAEGLDRASISKIISSFGLIGN